MSCGENRMTSGFSGLFHLENTRQKEMQFRGYHRGKFDVFMDLNPHPRSFTAKASKQSDLRASKIKIH